MFIKTGIAVPNHVFYFRSDTRVVDMFSCLVNTLLVLVCYGADKRVGSAKNFKGFYARECVVTARDNEGRQKAR